MSKIIKKKFANILTSKNILFLLFFVIVVSTMFFSFSKLCLAQGTDLDPQVNTPLSNIEKRVWEKVANFLGTAFFAPIIAVLWIIASFCYLFVNIAAYFLESMLSPSLYNFTGESMITTGWIAVRDVCNLFFLLILLFIAFCTILQIERYHAKKILLTSILMALLVNFSKPIAIFIFDGSQLLMNFFLNKLSGGGSSYATTIANTSKIAKTIWSNEQLTISYGQGWLSLAVKYLFTIVFLFMFGTALFVMAIYLLIRIIALWLLIIVSPFAFLFNAIPDFKKMSSDWWDALFKYSYVGPAIAFFLWLSTFLLDSSLFKTLEAQRSSNADPVFAFVVVSIVPYFVVLVFLYAGLIISQKFGVAFAGAITSRANKAMSFFPQKGWKGTKWGAKKGWEAADRKLAQKSITIGGKKIPLSPKALKQAWDTRKKEIDEKIYGDAQADAQETLSQTFKKGQKPAGYYPKKRRAENIARRKKELEVMGTTDKICVAGIKALQGRTDSESQEMLVAYSQILEDGRNWNEWLKQGLGIHMSSENAKKAMYDLFINSGMDEQAALEEMEKFSDQAWGKGDYHLYGMTRRNADGTLRLTEEWEQAEDVAGKLKNANIQHLMINIHPEATLEVDAKGNPVNMNGLVGPKVMDVIENANGLHLNRCRPDFPTKNMDAAEILRGQGREHFVSLITDVYKEKQTKAGGKEQGKGNRELKDEYDMDY